MNQISIKERLDNLPHKPGVYYFKDKNGKIIYIGKAKSLKNRVRSYFRNSNPSEPKTAILISKIRELETIVTNSEVEALIMESNLIRECFFLCQL